MNCSIQNMIAILFMMVIAVVGFVIAVEIIQETQHQMYGFLGQQYGLNRYVW